MRGRKTRKIWTYAGREAPWWIVAEVLGGRERRGPQTQMAEDALHYGRIFNETDTAHAIGAFWADERIDFIDSLYQTRPMTAGFLFEIGRGLRILHRHALKSDLDGAVNQFAPQRTKESVLSGKSQVEPRRNSPIEPRCCLGC